MTEYIKLKTVIDAVNKVYYDTPDIQMDLQTAIDIIQSATAGQLM